jgi:hypothetical protein
MEENFTTNPQSLLDRLVDGELSEADRRELLLQLEHEPEGWRRCALAFLEAQCWEQELTLVARAPEHSAAPTVAASQALAQPAAPASQRSTWRQYVATTLAVGACFLIAMALGTMFRGGHGPGTSQVEVATRSFPLSTTQSANPWQVVTLAAQSPSGEKETVNIPAVPRDAVDENSLQQSVVLPPGVQRAFEQAGHRVLQRRQIVRVQIDSGHWLMVPVNQVEIQYDGHGSF